MDRRVWGVQDVDCTSTESGEYLSCGLSDVWMVEEGKLTWLIRECHKTRTTEPSPMTTRRCSDRSSVLRKTRAPFSPFAAGVPVRMNRSSGENIRLVSEYAFPSPVATATGFRIDLISQTTVSARVCHPTHSRLTVSSPPRVAIRNPSREKAMPVVTVSFAWACSFE